MLRHGDDHHVKVGDAQHLQHLGIGDVGALDQRQVGGGRLHHRLVGIHGQHLGAGSGQLAGGGQTVTTQTEHGVRFFVTHI